MRKVKLAILLVVTTVSVGFAQTTVPNSAGYIAGSLSQNSNSGLLSDSTRQLVHTLFKWGRLYGTIGAVGGGLMTAGSTSYLVRGDQDWSTATNLGLGASAMFFGAVAMVRFSHHREQRVLAALERGQPLPGYVAAWVPLVARYGPPSKK